MSSTTTNGTNVEPNQDSADPSATHEESENTDQLVSPEDMKLAVEAAREASQSSDDGMLTDLPGATTGGKKLAIIFTCTVCNTRSAKQFTEQAYRKGVVLVRCPSCQNLHLIADRLGMFEDKGQDGQGWDVEKAMAKLGENVVAVTDDNVLELTLKDVQGDKMNEIVDEQHETSPESKTKR